MNEDTADSPKLFPNLWARESPAHSVQRPVCHCFDPCLGKMKWSELKIHQEQQDTSCSGWQRLNELIDDAIRDGREEFSPGRDMSPEEWAQITTLPTSIAKLKFVKHFILYGSSLVRIPPEIGEMESLEQFSPYTSYRLHWFPYEIRRCSRLKSSTISTRALYGNYKYRPPFPRLPQIHCCYLPVTCSVCSNTLDAGKVQQCWVSLPVATDVIPLLVHACSDQCIARLPTPPKNYVQHPHTGGLELNQPTSDR